MTSLRCVSSTDILSMGLKPARLASATKASEIQLAFMPNAGSRVSSPGTSGLRPSPLMTRNSPMRNFLRRDNGAVNFDLVAFRPASTGCRTVLFPERRSRIAWRTCAACATRCASSPCEAAAWRATACRDTSSTSMGLQRFLDRLLGFLLRLSLLGREAFFFGGLFDRQLARNCAAEERHQRAENARRGRTAATARCQSISSNAAQTNRALGIVAELIEHGLFGRAARSALRHQQAGGKRDDQRGNLRHEAVADRQFGEDVGGVRQRQAMAGRRRSRCRRKC